eukprot:gene30275-36584_t
MTSTSSSCVIGILALQGAVEEHSICVSKLGCTAKEIRVPEDLEGVDGLIFPGGESTAMAIVGEKCGLFPRLKDWVQTKKPVWGTCAGMILLSDHAIKQKEGGQALIGGLDVTVCRNYFGSQLYSREMQIAVDPSVFSSCASEVDMSQAFNAVFIRAPAILKTGPSVEVLATLSAKPHTSALAEVLATLSPDPSSEDRSPNGEFQVIVAVRQGNILATAFHPELTSDLRWHKAFVHMVQDFKAKGNAHI